MNELIVLEQLPVIKERLEEVSLQIKEKVDNAKSLVCTEETVKEVKKVRADLNKEFNELETNRKQVKEAIMQKYNEFEDVYKDKVANLYKDADMQLKEKIDTTENALKKLKEEDLRDFFLEHQAANHLQGFVEFEDVGLNVTLSSSIKSLKEQVKAFCDKVANDLKAIQTDDNSEEILLEYKNNGFDYAKAKTTIAEKKKTMEEFKMKLAKNGEEIKQEELIVQNIETMVSAPIEIVEEEKFEFEFKVKMTKSQARELKEWFNTRGVEIIG